MKLKAFIGSSKEHLDLARALQENLESDLETRVWDQDVFHLSEYPLDDLRTQLEQSDLGIFILSPADLSLIRNKRHSVPRDNVIFELGFFAGYLGHRRTFIIVPSSIKNLHLPSDLHGLTVGSYDPERANRDPNAALGPVSNKIRKIVAGRMPSIKTNTSGLIKAGLFNDFDKEYEELFLRATKITLYFIHSRRWRETNNDLIHDFLKKSNAELSVFLPDLRQKQLIKNIMEHFDDGPYIPGFIADAYRYFIDLKLNVSDKVNIRLFNIYPAYSFYKFDDISIVAMYPTTAIRKSVPTFKVASRGSLSDFIKYDLDQLIRECRKPTLKELIKLSQSKNILTKRPFKHIKSS